MAGGRLLVFGTNIFELTKYVFLVAILVALFFVFVGSPVFVRGESMEPNFHSGQIVIVEHLSFNAGSAVRRGDVVAAKFPLDPTHTRLIKRVVGLPGETVTVNNGHILINAKLLPEDYAPHFGAIPYPEIRETKLGSGQYFLAGDNRPGSSDSRLWGAVESSDILGRVSFVIWPPKDFQYVTRPIGD
ncbi:signal peptidase I [Candidatus Berkelbacteria bacterium RIFCSPLOWO2_01_FULL_50_28]|uniref:Signal peptidase I n=1 Tax=Candidatus Berkelbacteria bacterium RIFCSPLOWO2_01_FULL_50_28 TaxID=1797471 RepID=A0A1F5EAY8_9BACT|nr:MAG: signal peptidase I [Candidatus Berkelbacteria bacterium RIFCSPHIGHO2_01_FULL_50_36]OGD64501.1 MAG: signal peptidase I [Candidatus Berkelbacteria bacterium RIFCSPLOWO2_01_FULL_50_28]